MARPILFDTDPGVDDAMALLFALRSPELEVLGVTTTFGNAGVEQTTVNALQVLDVAGRPDIPVAAGANRPLVRPYLGRRGHIHGEDGLGNAAGPRPARQPLDIPAAQFIAATVLAHPGEITLVAVGPLTNLALAVRLEPRVVTSVRQVILMGGAAFGPGNASPVAEANILHDPEAAAIVFSEAWRVVMVGLDVTQRTVMTPAYLEELFSNQLDPVTAFIARIVPVYLQSYRERFGMAGIPTHDPSAVAYAIDPTLFQVEQLPVYVETQGRSAGQTVPDRLRQWSDAALPAALTEVCLDVDSERLLKLYRDRLAT